MLKTFLCGSAVSHVLRSSWAGTLIHEVSAVEGDRPATLKIALSHFPALTQPWGSVRIGTSAIVDNRPASFLYYPVIINRGPNDELYALNAECTHAGCTVQRLDSQDHLMRCPCHGSIYGIDGSVVQGPANFPLRRYALRTNDRGELLVEIPDLVLDVIVAKVLPPNADRLELEFISFDQIQYEVRFIPAIGGPEQIVPFSLTASGPLDQTALDGISDFTTVYVARNAAAGFFQVAMKARQV